MLNAIYRTNLVPFLNIVKIRPEFGGILEHFEWKSAMLRLNRLTDYGVVALSKLALCRDDVTTATQLAADTGINQPTIAKLMKQLAHTGMVNSHRGANGGYTLARPADEISVSEIIEALEGPIELTACVDGSEACCSVESSCPMRGNWNQVNFAIRTALENISLADMAVPAWLAPLMQQPRELSP